MIPKAVEVRLRPEDRAVLEARVRAPTTAQRDASRARIVLLAAEGRSTRSIAEEVGVMPNTVSTWRARYAGAGLTGQEYDPRAKRVALGRCWSTKPRFKHRPILRPQPDFRCFGNHPNVES